MSSILRNKNIPLSFVLATLDMNQKKQMRKSDHDRNMTKENRIK